MFDIGRVCVKIAGRDAGETCVVVEKQDEKFVLIDGCTRRRRCNVAHLEPTQETVDIKAKASHDDVVKALAGIGVDVPKKAPARKAKEQTAPKKKPGSKAAPKKEKKAAQKEKPQGKAAAKKESEPEEKPKKEAAPKPQETQKK